MTLGAAPSVARATMRRDMPDNAIAVAGIIASGVITPSIVAAYALSARRRDERLAAHEHQLTLLEDALNNVSRQRRLLYMGYSMWRHETDPMDSRTLDNDKAVTEAVEAVWISENHLRIRFGEDAPVSSAYAALVEALDGQLRVYNRHGDSAGKPPSPADRQDWVDVANAVVRAQKHFVQVVRAETEPIGLLRAPRTPTRRRLRRSAQQS